MSLQGASSQAGVQFCHYTEANVMFGVFNLVQTNMRAQHAAFSEPTGWFHTGLCFCHLRNVFAFHNSHVKVILLSSEHRALCVSCVIAPRGTTHASPGLGSDSLPCAVVSMLSHICIVQRHGECPLVTLQ